MGQSHVKLELNKQLRHASALRRPCNASACAVRLAIEQGRGTMPAMAILRASPATLQRRLLNWKMHGQEQAPLQHTCRCSNQLRTLTDLGSKTSVHLGQAEPETATAGSPTGHSQGQAVQQNDRHHLSMLGIRHQETWCNQLGHCCQRMQAM